MLDVDLDSLIRRGESAYLEFKSALDGRPGEKKGRKAEAIRDDIAEAVAHRHDRDAPRKAPPRF